MKQKVEMPWSGAVARDRALQSIEKHDWDSSNVGNRTVEYQITEFLRCSLYFCLRRLDNMSSPLRLPCPDRAQITVDHRAQLDRIVL
jgi:hypothetical protein